MMRFNNTKRVVDEALVNIVDFIARADFAQICAKQNHANYTHGLYSYIDTNTNILIEQISINLTQIMVYQVLVRDTSNHMREIAQERTNTLGTIDAYTCDSAVSTAALNADIINAYKCAVELNAMNEKLQRAYVALTNLIAAHLVKPINARMIDNIVCIRDMAKKSASTLSNVVAKITDEYDLEVEGTANPPPQ